jgi:immune inhibitor A
MRRTLSTLTAMAVGAAALTAAATTASASAEEGAADRGAAAVDKPLWQQAQNYYSTLRAPRVPDETEIESVEGPEAEPTWWEEAQRKHSTGFPPAAQELARREALADKGLSPARSLMRAGAENVTEARLLTLLVEFDPDANDDFSGWERPADNPTAEVPCYTEPEGTFFGGPLHNELPDPATVGTGRDNNTFWVPDFSPEHYEKIIYSEEGLTEKVRPDLDGGIDLSGYTVRNHYKEMSSGKYLIDGTVTPWLMLPHSEAWYSADSCAAGEASDIGHPDNPRGTAQMAIDAVAALQEADPDFDFTEYDQEDQADFDDDGDLFEPDGILDHVVVIHAGADQADDGGEQGTYAEWSSSSTVDPAQGGYEVPGTGVKVFNYTTQPEDAGVGVISHEYGHDLGLPDLYDSIGPTDTDVAFWDLMSTGSHSGPIFQGIPTHMGAWSKYVLGWIDPEVVPYGSARRNVTLGQAAKVPAGTESAVKIQLPNKDVQVGEPHSGELAWWTSNDQDDADVRLTRSVDVPEGDDVRFWMWNDYVIEEFWDYGFVELSADGGDTWEQMVVRDESGEVVTTNEDPNGNLEAYFGGMENGLTGSTDGYRHDWIDLSPYAGSTVQVRLRYMTDAAFVESGWFADDFSVTDDGTEVWTDDVESGDNGWTQEVLSIGGGGLGAGWIRTSGSFSYEQYYLAEWRNTVGFDKGLLTPYTTNFHVDGEWNVNRMPYNAPGMLIWHRDASHSFNDISNNLYDAPSIGAKGQVLLVDSHFNPRRLRGAAAEANPSVLDNLDSRAQAQDVAFGPTKRGFEYCYPSSSTDPYAAACNWFGPRPGKNYFTDQRTWYPGVEYRPDLLEETGSDLFFRDDDASTVVPSRNNEFYTTRVVDKNGKVVRELIGFDMGGGHVLGTGHPKDGRPAVEGHPGTERDLSLGVRIKFVGKPKDNTSAKVWLQPGYRR